MTAPHTLAYRTAHGWAFEGDLSKAQALVAAKALRADGVVAFVYPTASLHLVTFN